jgi:hypothetical protein
MRQGTPSSLTYPPTSRWSATATQLPRGCAWPGACFVRHLFLPWTIARARAGRSFTVMMSLPVSVCLQLSSVPWLHWIGKHCMLHACQEEQHAIVSKSSGGCSAKQRTLANRISVSQTVCSCPAGRASKGRASYGEARERVLSAAASRLDSIYCFHGACVSDTSR